MAGSAAAGRGRLTRPVRLAAPGHSLAGIRVNIGTQDETRSRKENAMPIYVTLFRFTEKGIHNVKDTVKRAEAFWSRAKKHDVTVKEMIWTQGAHDVVVVFEAPDDETASIVILSADELGTVRTETMRGFTAAEMEKLLAKVD
jgi:uncharacterized protein with GYD domain